MIVLVYQFKHYKLVSTNDFCCFSLKINHLHCYHLFLLELPLEAFAKWNYLSGSEDIK